MRVEGSKLGPLGEQDDDVDVANGAVSVSSQLDSVELTHPGRRYVGCRRRIKCRDARSELSELSDDRETRRASEVIGARLEGEAKNAHSDTVEIVTSGCALHLPDHAFTLLVVDGDHPAHHREVVAMTRGNMVLEASGGITLESIAAIAATGVDYISCGDLTKSVEPMDLSMRFLVDESST